MPRAVRSIVWSVGLAAFIAGANGCAHMIENRAINDFAKSLEAKDMDRLTAATSEDFHQRALRSPDSLQDFKIINLPGGKTNVIEVEEISKDKKHVTVQVGEQKKEIFYELKKDSNGKWVVDDIFMKQKKKGLEVHKSVSEQMDLFLSVREFLTIWSDGDREQVLSTATPKLRSALADLPPKSLAQITRQVSRGKPKSGVFNPQASMDEKVAWVKLPRMSGETVLQLELRKGAWRIADIGVASKDEEEKLPSVLNLAMAINRCVSFLAAYQTEDKTKLGELCNDGFFKGSLSLADLKQVGLPDPQLPDHDLKVQLRGNRADFTLKSPTEFVQIDMRRATDSFQDTPSEFQVADVTIYEIESKQEKRLSALFTAQGMLEVFIDALAKREIESVKHCSTMDFSNRVWNKLTDATVSSMPLEIFDSTDVEYVSSQFQGALTRIEVRQGGHPITYMLTDEGGRFMVDDVQWHMPGTPSSMKVAMEILIPIQDFASGITLGRDPESQEKALDMIRRNSTGEFNKMVWAQAQFVPNSGMSADTFLQAPLKSMTLGENEAAVILGDSKYGAKITLKQEHNRFIVDEIMLIAGAEEAGQLSLKQTLRTQMANGVAKAPSQIVQASFEQEDDPTSRKVSQAIHKVDDEGNTVDDKASVPPRRLDFNEADPFDGTQEEIEELKPEDATIPTQTEPVEPVKASETAKTP